MINHYGSIQSRQNTNATITTFFKLTLKNLDQTSGKGFEIIGKNSGNRFDGVLAMVTKSASGKTFGFPNWRKLYFMLSETVSPEF